MTDAEELYNIRRREFMLLAGEHLTPWDCLSPEIQRIWVMIAQHNETKITARVIANLEAGVRGRREPGDIWPDWVYEATRAIQHQNEQIPWLPDLLKILEWQGGTVHQALNAVSRLVDESKKIQRKQP